jgi:carbon monoxide dehydrogenase subunit G
MSATIIESDKVDVAKSAEQVFNFLSDFNNFEKLMPSQVTNWQSTKDDCSFTLNGMTTLGMKITERTPNSKILISSNGKVPFDFTMDVTITENGAASVGQIVFEADLNPMMKMMVVGPMGKFFNYLAKKLSTVEM